MKNNLIILKTIPSTIWFFFLIEKKTVSPSSTNLLIVKKLEKKTQSCDDHSISRHRLLASFVIQWISELLSRKKTMAKTDEWMEGKLINTGGKKLSQFH